MSNEPDREKARLRGLVKTCVEETNFPGITAPDGTKISDWKHISTSEYTVDGRLLSQRGANSDGSTWARTQSYEADGRLAKIISDGVGRPRSESLYSYDEAGRLVTISNSFQEGDRTEFQYHTQGHKTVVQRFDARTLQRARKTQYCGSLWDAAVNTGIGVPEGGSITTLYGGNDHPTEAQIQDSKGRIVTRLIRTYDADGRILEEKQVHENPALLFTDRFSIEQQVELTDTHLETMNAGMKLVLDGQTGTGISNTYDSQGRVIEMREDTFGFARVTTTRYNEQGDKVEEHSSFTRNSVIPIGVPHSLSENGTLVPNESAANVPASGDLPENSENHYTYKYDDYGNWTEETMSCRFRPGGAFESSMRRLRSLTYY